MHSLPLIGKAKMRFGHNNLLSFPTVRFPKHIVLASNTFEEIKANFCAQNAFWLYQLVVRNAEFLSYSNLANLQNSGDYCSKPHTCFIASRASSVRATASSLARDAAAASFAISGASSKILLCSTTSEPHKQPTLLTTIFIGKMNNYFMQTTMKTFCKASSCIQQKIVQLGDRGKMMYYSNFRQNDPQCWIFIDLPRPSFYSFIQLAMMDRTPFYRTSNEFEHHFLNIKRSRTCSSIDDRTRTSYFGLRMNERQISNLIGLSLDLQNYSLNSLEHHYFEHPTNSKVFIYW